MADAAYMHPRGPLLADGSAGRYLQKLCDTGQFWQGKSLFAPCVVDMGAQNPQYTVISAGNTGDNIIIAGTPGVVRKVHSLVCIPSASLALTLKAGNNGLSGAMSLVAGGITAILSGQNGPLILNYNPQGWFDIAAGLDFIININASNVRGFMCHTNR